MKKAADCVDYMFYRIYCHYDRRGYGYIADEMAVNLVALVQFIVILDLFIVVKSLVSIDILDKYFNSDVWVIVSMVLLMFLNRFRYRKIRQAGYTTFHKRWGTETKERRRRRFWLILMLILFLIPGLQILLALL